MCSWYALAGWEVMRLWGRDQETQCQELEYIFFPPRNSSLLCFTKVLVRDRLEMGKTKRKATSLLSPQR